MAPSVNEQYIVDEKGNSTAGILPIKKYKKILSALEEVADHRETKILPQSAEFKKLVKRGLDELVKSPTPSLRGATRRSNLSAIQGVIRLPQ
jgi:hypothetical protein